MKTIQLDGNADLPRNANARDEEAVFIGGNTSGAQLRRFWGTGSRSTRSFARLATDGPELLPFRALRLQPVACSYSIQLLHRLHLCPACIFGYSRFDRSLIKIGNFTVFPRAHSTSKFCASASASIALSWDSCNRATLSLSGISDDCFVLHAKLSQCLFAAK
jgi:hypothetical protein